MKFIVIEGLDGAGKSTQIKYLGDYLSKIGISHYYLHFPRTDSPVFGDLIARFLRGEFGKLDEVNPYLVALIYAGDRKDASETISKHLDNNQYVIVDRYVYSNIAYQCAKIADDNKRHELKDWIINLEYSYYKIPKPDLNIFLDVPFQFTESKLSTERKGDDRNYLNGNIDIHEKDLDFQRFVREVYLSQATVDGNLIIVDCTGKGDSILPPEKIFDKILAILKAQDIL
ncbi:MAG: dTMP kinase [Bacteroidales bacterium]|nr:dTMP kinase [Bacteroidales bacterium]